jgi:hypothetical protein
VALRRQPVVVYVPVRILGHSLARHPSCVALCYGYRSRQAGSSASSSGRVGGLGTLYHQLSFLERQTLALGGVVALVVALWPVVEVASPYAPAGARHRGHFYKHVGTPGRPSTQPVKSRRFHPQYFVARSGVTQVNVSQEPARVISPRISMHVHEDRAHRYCSASWWTWPCSNRPKPSRRYDARVAACRQD